MQIQIFWPAVALAALLGVVVNAIWYSPMVMGGVWQRLTGLSDESLRAGLAPRLGLAVVASFVTAFCLDGFMNFLGSNTFGMGALAGLEFCVGLTVPVVAMDYVMSQRSPKQLAVVLAPVVLVALLQGGLLAAWK